MVLYYKEIENEHSPLMVFLHGGGVSGWMRNKQIEYFNINKNKAAHMSM